MRGGGWGSINKGMIRGSNKQMVQINSNISAISLNIDGLNAPRLQDKKIQKVQDWIKKTIQLCAIYKRYT